LIHESYIPYPSSDYDNKPTRIVVHAMGEYIKTGKDTYTHAVAFLNDLKLSAHVLVAPNGDIYRCRYDDERASHAKGFNTDSLGIEFLVKGNHDYGTFLETIKTDYITHEQLDAGLEVVKEWLQLHNIKTIERHSDISPGRKVDPGEGFDWKEFVRKI